MSYFKCLQITVQTMPTKNSFRRKDGQQNGLNISQSGCHISQVIFGHSTEPKRYHILKCYVSTEEPDYKERSLVIIRN